ncbi:MAG: hypothetical protein AMXMBFR79_12280 [Chitinophagaceae bacterium]
MINSIINKLRLKRDPTLTYLRKEPNLKLTERIYEQLRSNEPIIEYHYKDDILHIINEPASLYHIVNSTSKLEKLANSININDDATVFDIGANVGIFSYFVKKRFPSAKLFSFEPDKKLIPIINKNLYPFKNYHVMEVAITDYDGEIDFFYNIDSSQVNSTEVDALTPFTTIEKMKSNKVKCRTISSFCQEHNIKNIDLLKIDIQGGEYKALKASENIFGITNQMLVEICFLMPDTIPLINLVSKYYKKHEPVNEIIMGADLRFFN